MSGVFPLFAEPDDDRGQKKKEEHSRNDHCENIITHGRLTIGSDTDNMIIIGPRYYIKRGKMVKKREGTPNDT